MYTINFTFSLNETGLTPNGRVYDVDGVPVGSLITTGFVELVFGNYSYEATFEDDQVGSIIFWDSDDTTNNVPFAINPQELAPTPTLSGSESVTINFTNADDEPVPFVRFRIIGAGDGQADEDGVATFSLDEGTYTLTASQTNGTIFPVMELVIPLDESPLIVQGSGITIPVPEDPAMTAAWTITRNGQGVPVAGAKMYFKMFEASPTMGDEGEDSWSQTPFEAISDSDGLVVVNIPKARRYQQKRGAGKWGSPFTSGTESTFRLPEVLGV